LRLFLGDVLGDFSALVGDIIGQIIFISDDVDLDFGFAALPNKVDPLI
jgi:hypothetical protein